MYGKASTISLAILADDSPKWKPSYFTSEGIYAMSKGLAIYPRPGSTVRHQTSVADCSINRRSPKISNQPIESRFFPGLLITYFIIFTAPSISGTNHVPSVISRAFVAGIGIDLVSCSVPSLKECFAIFPDASVTVIVLPSSCGSP